MKTLAKLLLINVFVFSLLFGLIELSIRILAPQNLRVDPENSHIAFGFSYRPRPGFEAVVKRAERVVTWKINSQGLRDNEIPYQKSADTYRIIGLGDSFTFGFHVEQEETFLHQLEQLLNDTPRLAQAMGKQRFQTVNMGVGAYGLAAVQQMLEREGLQYQPDMIITTLFVGNDVGETLNEHGRSLDYGELDAESGEVISWIYDEAGKPLSWRARKFLGSHFHTYVFLTTRLNMLLTRLKLVKVEEATIDILRISESDAVSQGWFQLKAYLRSIQETAETNNAKNLVMIVPLRHQVNEQEWALISQAYNLSQQEFELDKPQRILREFLAGEEIAYIDLLPILRGAQTDTYYQKDPHFNQAGHRISAEALFRYIEAQISSGAAQ